MSRVLSRTREAFRSPYDSLYQQNYDGIHRMLLRGWCGRLRGLCTRLLPLFLCEDEISQEVDGGPPTRRSGELAAFVHAEQLLDVCRFAEILHRDNVRTVRRRQLGVVEQIVTQCVPISMPARPFSYLVPSHWTRCVGPAILGFKMANCAIECEPTIGWCMRSVGFRVNLVHHDVNMKMLLVFVSNENVLVFLEAELVQRVQGGINPLCP